MDAASFSGMVPDLPSLLSNASEPLNPKAQGRKAQAGRPRQEGPGPKPKAQAGPGPKP